MLMAKKMKESPEFSNDRIVFIFSNSGMEREETLRFCKQCDDEFGLGLVWVEADVNPSKRKGTKFKVVTFETASRNGEPFEATISKYGIPNMAFPHCTRELKQRPINAYAETLFGKNYVTAIGIRFDEIGRMKRKPEVIYPMIDWQLTVRDVRAYWNSSTFDLQLKDYEGNCDLCWKKSIRKQLTLIKERPQITKWWDEMESKYAFVDKHGKSNPPFFFHRQNRSTEDLIELSKQPFVPVTDPHWRDVANPEMDKESSCACMNDSEPELDF